MINTKLAADTKRAKELGIPWFQFGEGAKLLGEHNDSVPTGCGATGGHDPSTCPWCQPAPQRKRRRR